MIEEQAAYLDHVDPERAQTLLYKARTKSSAVLRPISGITYHRLSSSIDQARQAADYLTSNYQTAAALRLGFEAVLDDLEFDPDRTEAFEEAMAKVGRHLGFETQRPEREIGSGPDVLWSLGGLHFWVIEAKSGALSDIIHKSYANQLGGSAAWFRQRYDNSVTATPIMVHPARRLAADASATAGMRILDQGGLSGFKGAVRAFSVGLASSRWDDPENVNNLLRGHLLRSVDVSRYLKDCRPSR